MAFESVVGQERVKELIVKAMAARRLAHAYLFHGQPGIGKDAMAIAVVMRLNCEAEPGGGCGACNSCAAILNNSHPGFIPVLPVPTKTERMSEDKYISTIRESILRRIQQPYREMAFAQDLSRFPIIGIDQIRLMKERARLRTEKKTYRVFLVSHADRMTQEASNSLLKLLEEPPERTIIILTTAYPSQLPRTVVSRCQLVRFNPLKEEDIAGALSERFGASDEAARFFSRMAGGSLQNGLSFLESDFEGRRMTALQYLNAVCSENRMKRIVGTQQFIEKQERVEVLQALRFLQVWFRDLLCIRLSLQDRVMNTDKREELNRFLALQPDMDIESGLASIEGAIDFIEKNVYLQLVVFSVTSKLHACIKRQGVI